MNERESSQPEVNPSDVASIREIAGVEGISFDAARKKWEMMKAAVNQQILEDKEK